MTLDAFDMSLLVFTGFCIGLITGLGITLKIYRP